MSIVKPFRAVHYNPDQIKDFKKVVCPPYDVISEEEQNYYFNLSPHNFIHLELNKDNPGDDKSNNKYTRAKKTFDEWQKKGVMSQDDKPCLYFYRQEYNVLGQKYNRLGFISLMELKDESESKVFPHENTHAHAVEDRLTLWSTVGADLSPIFVCYSDRQRKVEKIFNKEVSTHKPIFTTEDNNKVVHKIWKVSDPDIIEEVDRTVSGEHLFIADGHHRYKVASEIRQMRLKKGGSPDAPFNFVMTYFTNIDSKDLQILPMHRIVKHIPADFLTFLEENFRIDKVKGQEDLLILLAKAGLNEHAFGLYTRDGFRLLRLKNKTLIEQVVTEGSKDYKRLDATILKYFVFDKIGVKSTDIVYTKDLSDVTGMVDSQNAQASFIMNSVKIEQLKSIALNGERMPPKTTYFYPKVLSGLAVYKFE